MKRLRLAETLLGQCDLGSDLRPRSPPRRAAITAATGVGVRTDRPRSESERANVPHITQDAEAARGDALVERFAAIVRERCVTRGAQPLARCEALNRWLEDERRCEIASLQILATGLEPDGAALRAALTTSWSNTQAEGQITRLKLVKRQMYGRANFDLLRRGVLLAA